MSNAAVKLKRIVVRVKLCNYTVITDREGVVTIPTDSTAKSEL